jgi:phi13 family phage major tail protein
MPKNKVKYNLRNVHYALLTFNAQGNPVFGTPVHIPGAVSLSLEANGEPSIFYADGYAYYTVSNNQGYEGDLEIAMLPDSFRTDVLKETMDSNSVLIEDATVETAAFALLFEFDGDQKKIRHVMYNCTATRPTIESATNEEEIEVKTETLTIKASPLEGGYVKARTSDNTNATAYNNWYSSVYMPQNATFGVSPSSMILGLEDSGTATIAGALGTVTAAVTIEGETTGMVQAVVSGSTLTISTTDQTREAEYVVTLTDGGRTTGNTATVEVTVVDEGE